MPVKREDIAFRKRKTTGKLSTDDVAALRNADHVIFLFTPPHLNEISCAKHTRTGDFNSDIITYNITCSGELESLDHQLTENVTNGEFTIVATVFNLEFKTFVGMLRPGDQLEFLWRPDALTSVELAEAGLHCDQLQAIVFRMDLRLFFNIGIKIANGQDRMLKGLSDDYPDTVFIGSKYEKKEE